MSADITRLLRASEGGDPTAPDELLPLVYEELRRLASARMSREAPGHTLQPTALVHEAWLRVTGPNQEGWNGRGHFFAAAAEAMRRILIERARSRNRVRHGKGLQRVDFDKIDVALDTDDELLLQMDEALAKLAAESPETSELVKLRYFAGLSVAEAALALGISPATAKRRWVYARSWLFAELKRSQ